MNNRDSAKFGFIALLIWSLFIVVYSLYFSLVEELDPLAHAEMMHEIRHVLSEYSDDSLINFFYSKYYLLNWTLLLQFVTGVMLAIISIRELKKISNLPSNQALNAQPTAARTPQSGAH